MESISIAALFGVLGALNGALFVTIRRVRNLMAHVDDIERGLIVRVDDIEQRLIVAVAFAQVARDIARKIDGAK